MCWHQVLDQWHLTRKYNKLLGREMVCWPLLPRFGTKRTIASICPSWDNKNLVYRYCLPTQGRTCLWHMQRLGRFIPVQVRLTWEERSSRMARVEWDGDWNVHVSCRVWQGRYRVLLPWAESSWDFENKESAIQDKDEVKLGNSLPKTVVEAPPLSIFKTEIGLLILKESRDTS